MDTNKESAQASEVDPLTVKKDSSEKADCLESALSFATEWANLGGD